MQSSLSVFAYGSNMCVERLAARITSAALLTTAYVTHRRLAFHKRGVDGSAKANAAYTGRASDAVWGVVFSLDHADKRVLDEHESGYDAHNIVVFGSRGPLTAITYVARDETIDGSLKPFSWYHRFVIHGARQHQLPPDYIRHVQTFESIADPDSRRHAQNSQLIGSKPSGR